MKENTSLAAPGALGHCLQYSIWLLGGPEMTDGVWKGVYPWVFGRSQQLSQNKFFDPSTPSMRKKSRQKRGEKRKRVRIKVAITSLPAVDRPNADRWNAARLRQYYKTKENIIYVKILTAM